MTGLQERQIELEQSLQAAFEPGPGAVERQVRCILALSQTVPAPASRPPHAPEHLTAAEARLVLLSQLSETFSEAQAHKLLIEAQTLPHSAARLDILIRLIRGLPPHERETVIGQVWSDTRDLADPAARARVLFHLASLLRMVQDEHHAPAALQPMMAAVQAMNNAEARIRTLTAIVQQLPQAARVRTLYRLFDEIDLLPNDRLRCSSILALVDYLPRELEARALDSAVSIQTPVDRARAFIRLAHAQPRLRADALDAVRLVASEDERAELLIAFASLLENSGEKEYTALWEQTRALAEGINRRHLRARALVALAPHLTPDLLDETLAIIRVLSSERDKAVLLGELAPNLLPNKVTAALQIARAMRSVDSRLLALSALARYLPANMQSQVAREVLAQAADLSHPYEQVTALVGLAELLPAALHQQLWTMALERALRIENENARARAISLLGPRLPGHLLPRALEAAYQFTAPNHRMGALSSLAPVLDDDARRDALYHLLDSVREISQEYKRARALVNLAPLLPPDLLQKVQIEAEALDDPFDRAIVYIALAQNLPPDQRAPVIAHTWTLIKQIESGYDAASTIVAIAPYLPDALHADLLETATSMMTAIRDEYDRASAMSLLAPLLLTNDHQDTASRLPDSWLALEEGLMAAMEAPQPAVRAQLLAESVTLWTDTSDIEQRYRLWQGVALKLATLPLVDSLLCLGALLPVVRSLAGEEEIADIARSLLMRYNEPGSTTLSNQERGR